MARGKEPEVKSAYVLKVNVTYGDDDKGAADKAVKELRKVLARTVKDTSPLQSDVTEPQLVMRYREDT